MAIRVFILIRFYYICRDYHWEKPYQWIRLLWKASPVLLIVHKIDFDSIA
jgi:hypothetical protein